MNIFSFLNQPTISDLVNAAIATVAQDPFYREWFRYKDDLYVYKESAILVNYSELNNFNPTSMTGSKLSYLPFEFKNKFYIVAKLRWYDWKQRPGNYKERLAITEVPIKLFNEIKTQGKAFVLKLTTGQHNSPWNNEFKQKGESV